MCLKNFQNEISLAVQWLGCDTFTAEGLDSTPGQGTEIPQSRQQSSSPPKKLKERENRHIAGGGGDDGTILLIIRKRFILEQEKRYDFVIFNNHITISSENVPHTQ